MIALDEIINMLRIVKKYTIGMSTVYVQPKDSDLIIWFQSRFYDAVGLSLRNDNQVWVTINNTSTTIDLTHLELFLKSHFE